MADWNSATDLQTLTGSAAFSQVQDCLKAIDGTTGTPPTTLFCGTTIRFEGSAADEFETELTVTNPTADRTQTLQDNSGIVPLGTAGNTLFLTTSGVTNVTLPTSGNIPSGTAGNAITFTTTGATTVTLPTTGTLGTGNTAGAASSTDNAIARFDSTTGKILQNSGVIVDDSDNVTGVTIIKVGNGSAAAPSMSFITEPTCGFFKQDDNTIGFSAGGAIRFSLGPTQAYIYVNFSPVGAGSLNSGEASQYWADISYKTLTDRGCLGWFDNGVEMPNGKILSDIEAIKAIKKHPKKKTVYGIPMLDYKSFPKVSYKPADKDGKLLPRDENDEPYWVDKKGEKRIAADGVEMTSMYSIMLGALKELAMKNELLENRILQLEKV